MSNDSVQPKISSRVLHFEEAQQYYFNSNRLVQGDIDGNGLKESFGVFFNGKGDAEVRFIPDQKCPELNCSHYFVLDRIQLGFWKPLPRELLHHHRRKSPISPHSSNMTTRNVVRMVIKKNADDGFGDLVIETLTVRENQDAKGKYILKTAIYQGKDLVRLKNQGKKLSANVFQSAYYYCCRQQGMCILPF